MRGGGSMVCPLLRIGALTAVAAAVAAFALFPLPSMMFGGDGATVIAGTTVSKEQPVITKANNSNQDEANTGEWKEQPVVSH